MSSKYEEWASCHEPLHPEDFELPQLYLMEVSFVRGYEIRPYIDAGEVEERPEFIPKPCEDVLVVRLRRGDNNKEETFTFNGLDAGRFLKLIMPVRKETVDG